MKKPMPKKRATAGKTKPSGKKAAAKPAKKKPAARTRCERCFKLVGRTTLKRVGRDLVCRTKCKKPKAEKKDKPKKGAVEPAPTMQWYVFTCQSGSEEAVKKELLKRIRESDWSGYFGRIIVPRVKAVHATRPKWEVWNADGEVIGHVYADTEQQAMDDAKYETRCGKLQGRVDIGTMQVIEDGRRFGKFAGEKIIAVRQITESKEVLRRERSCPGYVVVQMDWYRVFNSTIFKGIKNGYTMSPPEPVFVRNDPYNPGRKIKLKLEELRKEQLDAWLEWQPHTLSKEEVKALLETEKALKGKLTPDEVKPEEHNVKVGDDVEVVSGTFGGVIGTAFKVEGELVHLEAFLLGKPIKVVVKGLDCKVLTAAK